jgi:hypothetical protein
MASTDMLTAMIERAIEQLKKENPEIELKRKPLSEKPKDVKARAKRKATKCSKISGQLH